MCSTMVDFYSVLKAPIKWTISKRRNTWNLESLWLYYITKMLTIKCCIVCLSAFVKNNSVKWGSSLIYFNFTSLKYLWWNIFGRNKHVTAVVNCFHLHKQILSKCNSLTNKAYDFFSMLSLVTFCCKCKCKP